MRWFLLLAVLLSSCHKTDDAYWQGYVEGEYVMLASPYAGQLQKLHVRRGEQTAIGKLAGELAHARTVSLADGIAAAAGDKRRARVMLGLVTAADRDPTIKRRMRKFIGELRGNMAPLLGAGGLQTDPDSIAFFHCCVIGCAVLQLARDNPEARAEARSVLKKAAAAIAKGKP